MFSMPNSLGIEVIGGKAHVVLFPSQLRPFDQLCHQVLVPKEPIIRLLPHGLAASSGFDDILLSLQTVGEVPSVREP